MSDSQIPMSALFVLVFAFAVVFVVHRYFRIVGILVDTPYGEEFWFMEPFRVWFWS